MEATLIFGLENFGHQIARLDESKYMPLLSRWMGFNPLSQSATVSANIRRMTKSRYRGQKGDVVRLLLAEEAVARKSVIPIFYGAL